MSKIRRLGLLRFIGITHDQEMIRNRTCKYTSYRVICVPDIICEVNINKAYTPGTGSSWAVHKWYEGIWQQEFDQIH